VPNRPNALTRLPRVPQSGPDDAEAGRAMDLHDKVAIVTGASRGVGKHTAIELGRRGAKVVIAARTVEARRVLPGTIGETVAAIEATGAEAIAVQADMANALDLDRLVATTVERFGGVDILINNAAATSTRSWGAPLLELSREDWMAQFAVNIHAPFSLTRAVVPIMQSRGGGRVINVTTGSAELLGHTMEDPEPEMQAALGTAPLAYFSSKAALDRFCRVVAPQLRELGVSIVNVHPGAVHTELVDVLVQRGLDPSNYIPMDIPAKALGYLASCDDPMAYTGGLYTAENLVAELGL
jgi:NAD(P)-dependent dehydrogenase (short-subunit alcohol dehydrogenase family)